MDNRAERMIRNILVRVRERARGQVEASYIVDDDVSLVRKPKQRGKRD